MIYHYVLPIFVYIVFPGLFSKCILLERIRVDWVLWKRFLSRIESIDLNGLKFISWMH